MWKQGTAGKREPDVASRLLEHEFDAARPMLGRWFGDDLLRASLREEIESHLAQCNGGDPGSAVPRMRILRLPGRSARMLVIAFCERMDNESRPHGLVLHRSFEFSDVADVQAVSQAWRKVKPGRSLPEISLFCYAGDRPAIPATLRTHFVAAPIARLIGLDVDLPRDVRLVRPQSLDFLETYQSWYEAFWRLRPELERRVPVETPEDLQMFVDQGELRLVYLGDCLCGLVAAMRHRERGLSGWRLRERVLAPSHWGRGLAAPILVAFARSIDHQPHDAIWGLISPENESSLRSALRTGREIIGSLYVTAVPAAQEGGAG